MLGFSAPTLGNTRTRASSRLPTWWWSSFWWTPPPLPSALVVRTHEDVASDETGQSDVGKKWLNSGDRPTPLQNGGNKGIKELPHHITSSCGLVSYVQPMQATITIRGGYCHKWELCTEVARIPGSNRRVWGWDQDVEREIEWPGNEGRNFKIKCVWAFP